MAVQGIFVFLQNDRLAKVLNIMSEERKAKIISLIRDTIREAEPTAQIILYGSRARGDAREDSDWDVLVIVDKEKTGLADIPFIIKGLTTVRKSIPRSIHGQNGKVPHPPCSSITSCKKVSHYEFGCRKSASGR